jgi:hypothetical protein
MVWTSIREWSQKRTLRAMLEQHSCDGGHIFRKPSGPQKQSGLHNAQQHTHTVFGQYETGSPWTRQRPSYSVGYRDDGAWESGQSEGGDLGLIGRKFQAAESRGHHHHRLKEFRY